MRRRLPGCLCRKAACMAAASVAVSAVCGTVWANEESMPADKYGACYEVFVYSFCDSDGDGIGDLQGLIGRLDYIEELGFDSIWLMPINPSTTYHKYDVTDYCDIDPQYGTLEDFDELAAACQERGLKLYMDMVINHTSSAHPWFEAAASYLQSLQPGEEANAQECPYVDYYHFVQADAAPRSGWYLLEGTADWYYEGVFWDQMPDLNLDNPDVRSQLEAVADFWMDRGVMGFRMDAALHYTESDNQASAGQLQWFYDYVEAANPQIYVVAEVWSTLMTMERFYACGVDSLFDFELGSVDGQFVKSLNKLGNGKNGKKLAETLEKLDTAFREVNDHAVDGVFLSNHDTGRAAGFLRYDLTKLKLAAALELLTTGCVYVYYGEELGMTGSGIDENKRAPMFWTAEDSPEMTDGPAAMEPQEHRFPSCEQQMEDPDSLYSFYKEALAVRNQHPQIRRGVTVAMTEVIEANGNICAVKKTWEGSSVCLLYNLSEEEAAVEIPSAYGCTEIADFLVTGQEEPAYLDGVLTIPACGCVVLAAG